MKSYSLPYAILIVLIQLCDFSSSELIEKKCRLNDPVRFINYNFEGIDQELQIWESSRFYVSLCNPIPRDKILEKCSTEKVDDVFFLNVVEPEYKNCLLLTRDDIYLSYN